MTTVSMQNITNLELTSEAHPRDVNPLYRTILRDLMRVADEQGDAALYQEPHATAYARMLLMAPKYFCDLLDERMPGQREVLLSWATDHVERHDYPEFFQLLEQIGDISRENDEGVICSPEHAGLFVRMMQVAPARFRAAADAIAEETGLMIPKPTHVNDDGQPIFSLTQIASHLGADRDEVHAFVVAHLDANAACHGGVHPIQ